MSAVRPPSLGSIRPAMDRNIGPEAVGPARMGPSAQRYAGDMDPTGNMDPTKQEANG